MRGRRLDPQAIHPIPDELFAPLLSDDLTELTQPKEVAYDGYFRVGRTPNHPRLRLVLQTGVDQAALRAAMACGLATGGWCPPGCVSEDGKIPDIFSLKETPEERSQDVPDIPRSQRTQWNVRDSDATLVLWPGDKRDLGTRYTVIVLYDIKSTF